MRVIRMLLTFTGLIAVLTGLTNTLQTQAATANSPINLQNATQIQELASLQVDDSSLRDVLFSPDSRYFVTLKCYDASMDLWDSIERQQWLDNALEVWNTETFRKQSDLAGHTDQITRIEFQPNGDLLASAGEDNTVRLWDVSLGEQIWSLEVEGNLISDLLFSPNGNLLAIIDGSTFPQSESNRVRIFDVGSLQEVSVLERPYAFTTTFSPDSSRLVVGGSDGSVWLWEMGESSYELETEDDIGIPIVDVTFSHDGMLVAVDNLVGLNVWNTADGVFQTTYGNHLDIDFTHRRYGDVFARLDGADGVQLFNIVTQQRFLEDNSLDDIGSMRAIDSSEMLLLSVAENQLRIWDISAGTEILALPHQDVFDTSISADNMYIASWSGSSGLLKIWGVPD